MNFKKKNNNGLAPPLGGWNNFNDSTPAPKKAKIIKPTRVNLIKKYLIFSLVVTLVIFTTITYQLMKSRDPLLGPKSQILAAQRSQKTIKKVIVKTKVVHKVRYVHVKQKQEVNSSTASAPANQSAISTPAPVVQPVTSTPQTQSTPQVVTKSS